MEVHLNAKYEGKKLIDYNCIVNCLLLAIKIGDGVKIK